MAWPLPDEYQAAVQNPSFSFKDTILKASRPELNNQGLPKVISGNFACVFQLRSSSETYAVRCFSREVTDQQRRYALLSQHLGSLSLPTLVGFEYLVEGIRLRGQWFPVVKMEWVEGQTLEIFVEKHLNNPEVLRGLSSQFRGLVAGLRGARMAHGDLQHGNMLVDRATRLYLVDYDAMFFPLLFGKRSPELGHPNYQHPQRSADDYDENLDNFAALVTYLSLLAVAAEPALWREFHTGDNLILTKQDYMEPNRSRCLGRLKESPDPVVAYLAATLEQFCWDSIDALRDLETVIQDLKVIKCPGCGHENVRYLIYCEKCARQLSQAMSQCGVCRSNIPPRASFCRVCGTKQSQ